MAKYVVQPKEDAVSGTNALVFEKLPHDLSNSSPSANTVNILSAVKKGDYVYSLSQEASVFSYTIGDDSSTGAGYPLDDLEMTRVVNIVERSDDVVITLSNNLKENVVGVGDDAALDRISNNNLQSVRADVFLFERDLNKVQASKIGFDRDAPQLVSVDVGLSDTSTGQQLQDLQQNDLVTGSKTFFADSLKSSNATSVNISNESTVGASGGAVTVSEQFPSTSEVSTNLLGIPRAETQLSLFSDVSTLGFDDEHWEFFTFQKPRSREEAWESRASLFGNRYRGKLLENTIEQALELSSNIVPYTYPYEKSRGGLYRADQFEQFKRFIILGNFLHFLFDGQTISEFFLDPAAVRMGTIKTGTQTTQNNLIRTIIFGENISEADGFRLIDRWTTTWQAIEVDDFPSASATFINSSVLDASKESDIVNFIAEIKALDEAQGLYNAAQIEQHQTIYSEELQNNLSNFTFNSTRPGYYPRSETDTDPQLVVLQTKEAFRYQPGRVSGFTFGSRAFIDSTTPENFAEWGVVNDTDQYVFHLAGGRMHIIRRSTVPLTEDAIRLSNSGEIRQREISDEVDLLTNTTKPTFYEFKVPDFAWNVDTLDGNGPSGYKVDVRSVTMWKIEFSWYGAVGAQFYAYIPVGNKEARWVKIHRMTIENTLTRACLENPYFKMKYELRINNRTAMREPQFVYKYGSSVYIDGGDEGTKRLFSYTSGKRVVPEDSDESPQDPVDNNSPLPLIGLKPKVNITNSQSTEIKNRLIATPETLSVDASNLVEVDFVECEACQGFGFTYDDGLIFNRDSSPAEIPSTKSGGAAVGASNSQLDKLGERLRDDSPNSGRTIDIIFDFDENNKAYRLQLVKPTGENGTTFGELEADDDNNNSPFISIRDHDAKLITPGLGGVYVDYFATLADTTITPINSPETETTDPPTAIYDKFRVTRIRETNRNGQSGESITDFQKLPMNEDFPLLTIPTTSQTVNNAGLAFCNIPNSPYFTFNSPHGGAYGASAGRSNEITFQDHFVTRHSASHSTIASKTSDSFPFRTVVDGDVTRTTVDRSVARNHTSGGIIPYSSLFGRIKLNRKSDAICTSNDLLVGKTLTFRFLNPHAGNGASGLNRSVFSGSYLHGITPEFSIGFTEYKPALTFKDDGTFTVGGTDRPLRDEDFIAVDYTHRQLTGNKVGESYYSERNLSLAGKFRKDYRVKAIPDELSSNGSVVSDNTTEGSSAPFTIGGFCSTVELSIDEALSFDLKAKTNSTWSNVQAEFLTDITDGTDFAKNVRIEGFENLTDDDSIDDPTVLGIATGGVNGYIIIEDEDFDTIYETINLKGGSVIDPSSTSTDHGIFKSNAIKIQYFKTADGTDAQERKDANLGFNGTAYIVATSLDRSDARLSALGLQPFTQIQTTFVKLSFPDGQTGLGTSFIRKLMSGNPAGFYPYIRLGKGAQLNSITVEQKTPSRKTIISPAWQVFGGALIHQPLLSTDPRQSKSLVSANASQTASENFEDLDRLSSLEVDQNIAKPLRTAVSDPIFKVLSNDPTGVIRITGESEITDLRGKFGERAKRIASYYFGGENVDGTIKRETETVELDSIFAEDKKKILPDELGNKAVFVRAQKVNTGDIASTAEVQASINVSEI